MTPPGTENPAPAKDTHDLGPRIDAVMSDGAETATRAAVPVGPVPTGRTSESIVSPPKAVGSSPDPAAAIESLDAQLAELTAELLDPKSAAATAPAPPAPVNLPVAEAVATAIPPAKPGPEVSIPAAPVAQPQEAPPPVAATPAQTAPPAATPAPAATTSTERAEPGALLSLLGRISAPLAAKSRTFRNAAGVLAINSLLLGAGVWGYVVFRPVPKPAGATGFDFASASLPVPPPAKDDATPQAAPKSQDEGHSSGGHDASSHDGAAKSKPNAKSSKAPSKGDKKAPAKKDAKPEEHKEGE
jgi:hypothetical protein